MAKNRGKPNHTTFRVGSRVLVTFHDGKILVDKTTGQFNHAKHLELRHFGKISWVSIRAAVRFNPEKHLSLLVEQKQILSKDGYSIPLHTFEVGNEDYAEVVHSMMAENATKESKNMARKGYSITDEVWRQQVADLALPVSAIVNKHKIGRSTIFRIRAVLEGRKEIGWNNMNPPSDIADNIPYLPLGVNVRQEVGNSVSAIANAGNAENLAAPVTVTRAPRQVFTSSDVRRLAGLLDTDAHEVSRIMGKPVNTVYKWKSILRGHFPISGQRKRRIPKDILEQMPLESPYQLTTAMTSVEPSNQVSIPLPTNECATAAVSTLATTPRSLIGMIDALSEKFLAAASELSEKKVALEALLDMEGQRTKTRSLLQEFDELSAEISNVLGS